MSISAWLIGDRYEDRKHFSGDNLLFKYYGLDAYKYAPKPHLKGVKKPTLSSWKSRHFNDLKYLLVKIREGISLEYDDIYDNPEIQRELLMEYRAKGDSHLICHPHFFGCYLPIDFKEINLASSYLLGLGSSFNLRDELQEIASKLDFELGKYVTYESILSDDEIDCLIVKMFDEDDLFGYEKMLVLQLYNLAIASISYDLVINFSG
ncbi:hypothetical protein [Pseudanabaena sp. UWO310]|uniref:hypothetical protein n=1 Tax=Pseudanabaena sp. UWO310 TaxID=2480795 RepID=UPI001158854F|nr:hypothetical protein [Pseudanabaena sp. UWO310]TYQ31779.1 hypothetical protein PseudUWO310_02325 [Pseudanabaena sp. UWO310]